MQDFIKKRFRKYAFSFYYPVVMGLPLSFVADFFEEFLFNDWVYLKNNGLDKSVDVGYGMNVDIMK
jgi:hypothetical protein